MPAPRPRQVDHHLGRTLGHVRIMAKLGQGGMGAVYRGHHERIDKDVAVKILPPPPDDLAQQFQERFLREGRTAARINHPNVVQVMDAGMEDGIAYLVMELVDGTSLGKVLEDKGRLPPQQVQNLAIAITTGLCAIHDQGIIHRDIKPDNLLLGHDGKVKITDLGLARETDSPELQRLTHSGMVVGTPLYVAPEAIRDSRSVSPATDIYSLGATLYHLLSGQPPFNGNTSYELMRNHLEQPVRPLRSLVPGIPKPLASLVEVCLEKDPAHRPTAPEVLRILRENLTVQGASSTRNLLLLAGSIVALIVVFAALGFLAIRPGPTDRRQKTATLRFPDLPQGTEIQLDEAAWQPLTNPLAVPGGPHRLVLRNRKSGSWLFWSGTVEADPSQPHRTITCPLEPVSLGREIPIALPGQGMGFCEGRAVGPDNTLILRHQGLFHLVRWDGQTAWSATATLDPNLSLTAWQTAPWPSGPGYFSQRSDDGHDLPPHHVCCWQEIDWVRKHYGMEGTALWNQGAANPHQRAVNLTRDVVTCLLNLRKPMHVRLPDRRQAEELSAAYGNGIWFQGDGVIQHLGSSSERTALLVLVEGQ